jgi:hypothetical protein
MRELEVKAMASFESTHFEASMLRASEVQAAASRRFRISAVLVGSASLDAMIGHLASLTGGEVFYAQHRDVGPAVRAAIASIRSPGTSLVGSTLEGGPVTASVVRQTRH